jgi:hypothetical protein
LQKDKKKYHWLKVDFNKWKDEDDSDDELGGGDELDEASSFPDFVRFTSCFREHPSYLLFHSL